MSKVAKHNPLKPEEERANFWLDVGPASGYIGTIAEETARKNGDVSPDGKRFHWQGGESSNNKQCSPCAPCNQTPYREPCPAQPEAYRDPHGAVYHEPRAPRPEAYRDPRTEPYRDPRRAHPERQNTEEDS